jgi:hypothetical protein
LFNPADFLLDAVSNSARVKHMIEMATVQQEKKQAVATSEASHPEKTPMYGNIDAEVLASTAARTPMYIALWVVVERMVKNLWRQQPSMFPTFFHLVCLFCARHRQLAFPSLLDSSAGEVPSYCHIEKKS